ncbi:MAG: 1-acyl-sn-glycerol-3-phosphate acyltransferase [Pseudomonadota bacterium]
MKPFVPYELTLTERALIAIGPIWRWFARHFPKAFAIPTPPPLHPSAMFTDPNWIFRLIFPRFFRRISVDDEAVQRLAQAAEGTTVVYITKYVGQLEYNYFNHLFAERNLPLASYSNALGLRRWKKPRAWWRSIALQESEIEKHGRPLDPITDGLLADMIAGSKSALIKIPPADLEEEEFVFTAPIKALSAIVKAQRKSTKPIMIAPLDFLWTRRPPKAGRSFIDIIFGNTESPGRIRKFYLFWRNYKRRAQASIGVPIDVRSFLNENPAASDEELALKLRQRLSQELRLQRHAITGAPIRPRTWFIQAILSDDALDNAICEIATSRGKEADNVRELALRYAKEIVSDLDYSYVEFFERVLARTLVKLFESFNVDKEGLARAKDLFQKGPVIFVPNHKSHADYLILSYVLYHNGMSIPLIAAGKNLSFWPLGRIFRKCGAFFIRRSFRGNELYKAVLETYLKVLLKEGHSQEFFIEGGRSRTGKLKSPRTGMLSMLQKAASKGDVKNMHYVPVSITYDRVIEQKSYMKELAGENKEEERTSHLLKLTKFLKRGKMSYGSIYVRFGTPLSCAEAGAEPKDLEKLAQNICREINRHIVVTPAAVSAAALLCVSRRGVTFSEFRQNAQAILACLSAKGAEIPPMLAESPLAILQDAISRLSHQKLVTAHHDALEPFISIDESKRVPLSYVRNSIAHFLVTTGVVCRLIRWHIRNGRFPNADDLADDLEGTKRLFLREFRFATSKKPKDHIENAVRFLSSQRAIELSAENRISITTEGRAYMNVFEAQILPSVERAWIAARVILERQKIAQEERALITEMLNSGSDLYLLGRIKFRETITRDGFANAIKTLEDFGLLSSERPNEDAAHNLKVELEKLL